MHYWVPCELHANYDDDRTSVDGDICWGIPSDAKSETSDEGEIQVGYGQSDVEIYIIGSTLKSVPSPMMNGWLRTKIYAGEFSQMRKQKQVTKLRYRSVMAKVMLKYTLLGHL